MPVFDAERNRQVVADNLVARLIHYLRDNGIDLAGHNRRAGLTLGQENFIKSATRSRRHKAEVVRHFDKHQRGILERGADVDKAVGVVGGVDYVRGGLEVFAGDFAELAGDDFYISRLCIKPRAHGGAAHVDKADAVNRPLNAADTATNRRGVRTHFLPQRDRNGVLQVRAPHFENILILLRLVFEGAGKVFERGRDVVAFVRQANLNRGREAVIGRLRHVRVIVRADDVVTPLSLADNLQRTVTKDFVHVHVNRRARTALNRVNGELVNKLAVDNFFRRLHKRVADFAVEASRLHVSLSRRFLHFGERFNQIFVEPAPRDCEVLNRPHGLHAVICLVGDFNLP